MSVLRSAVSVMVGSGRGTLVAAWVGQAGWVKDRWVYLLWGRLRFALAVSKVAVPFGGTAMADHLLVRNVRPLGGTPADILIRNGVIAAIGANLSDDGVSVLDGGGRLALPGLVEAHTHLDKSLLGLPWYRNQVGPRLIDKIDNERAVRKSLPIDPAQQSRRQALLSLSHGSTFIRSHVDVDTECGVAGIEGVMATRTALADLVTIDLVAFPQSGMLVRPGTVALMEQALRLGAETVGGLDPCAIDRDPKGHLDTVFGMAQRFGRGIDIHLHETGEMGLFSMELIIERTQALGMAGRVIVSHAFCLGMPDPALVDPVVAALAAAGIAIMTTASASRPVPSVRQLARAGVVVCAGSDGIRDTWGPYGNADMLERAMFVGLRNNFRRDDEMVMALDVVTTGGAKALGLPAYGLAPGCGGDVVLVAAETVAEAVAQRPGSRTVVKRGRVVADYGAVTGTAA
jgi:cytosine deaminase